MGTIQQWIGRFLAQLKPSRSTSRSGQQAEDMAAAYLTKQGMQLLTRNYLTRAGEIDLVMKDRHCLVFVEVRFRSRGDWAHAAESVTRQKQHKLIKAAKQYLQQHHQYAQPACRFDVVAIDASGDQLKIDWLPHAFY